jgi:UDP-N-acetylglucosamine--N-acetylmuramyl-(pentapeptide) pyrophosphoryl-undecaprenol N-acetylglucosamine transferase
VGGKEGLEARVVPAAGLTFVGITSGRVRKLVSPSTVSALFAGLKGIRDASSFLRKFRPNVVVGTGGYVASAVIQAAAKLRIPTIILEPNAASGRMNRLLAPKVTRICIAYEANQSDFPADKTVLTGVPIREGIVSDVTQDHARRELGLEPNMFTLLVAGGSQGAQSLNQIVLGAIPLLSSGAQVLHQTGEKNFDEVKSQSASLSLAVRYDPRPYFGAEQMPLAYRASDAILCRCGTTLAEVSANGIPALMVPLPSAYADHQTANAKAVERAGGGILLPQNTLTGERLAENIELLRNDEIRSQLIADASRSLGRPRAAGEVAKIAMEIAK